MFNYIKDKSIAAYDYIEDNDSIIPYHNDDDKKNDDDQPKS